MKIRTDFVTNSSSASSMDVTIDNPVLFEILQRYKDKGLFGDAETKFKIGEAREGNTLAFSIQDGDFANTTFDYHIYHLSEVIREIIFIMEDSDFYEASSDFDEDSPQYNEELFHELKEELKERAQEIDTAYTEVKWTAADGSWGSEIEPGNECGWDFHYDPASGERMSIEIWDDNGERV